MSGVTGKATMKIPKKLWGAAIVLALLLAVCTGSLQAQIAINFWYAMEGTKAQLMDEMAKDFMKEYPAIAVNVSRHGGYTELVRKIQAGILDNALPDVATLGQRHGVPSITDSGKLIPLDSVLTLEDRKDIGAQLFARYTYKNRIMAIPFAISTPVLHINATRFREVGLNPDKPPTTWEELVAYAKKLTRDVDADGRIDQWGFNFHSDTPWHVCAFIYQNGGDIYGKDGRSLLDSPAAIEAVQFLADLFHKHKVGPTNAHEAATKLFTAGNLAMFQRSSAFIEAAVKQIGKRFEYRVVYLPKGKVYAVPDGGGGLAAFKSVPVREKAALAFIKWMTSTEAIARFSRETGYITFRKSSRELKQMKEFFAKNPWHHVAAEQMEYVRSSPVNHADSAVWTGLGKLLKKVETDPKAGVAALMKELSVKVNNKELAEYRGQ